MVLGIILCIILLVKLWVDVSENSIKLDKIIEMKKRDIKDGIDMFQK